MLTVGIDAHHRYHAACVLDEHGKVFKEPTIRGGVALAGKPGAWHYHPGGDRLTN